MTLARFDPAQVVRPWPKGSDRYRVAVCGSFHRQPAQLRAAFDALNETCEVLSPASIDWVDPDKAFVRLHGQDTQPASDIESAHLDAIRRADFVWLHCPGGYVGTSASMELGFAYAVGVPVLASELPTDETFATRVIHVPEGVEAVAEHVTPDPGRGLAALQAYYERTARRRGWAAESARDTLLLLTEEVGEVARAVRKQEGLSRDGDYGETPIGLEIADVLLYLVHLANVLKVDLATAVSQKELINDERFRRRSPDAA